MEIELCQHIVDRIHTRHLFLEEVVDAIRHPDRITKKQGMLYLQKRLNRGTIEIVCEKRENHIRAITVYWT